MPRTTSGPLARRMAELLKEERALSENTCKNIQAQEDTANDLQAAGSSDNTKKGEPEKSPCADSGCDSTRTSSDDSDGAGTSQSSEDNAVADDSGNVKSRGKKRQNEQDTSAADEAGAAVADKRGRRYGLNIMENPRPDPLFEIDFKSLFDRDQVEVKIEIEEGEIQPQNGCTRDKKEEETTIGFKIRSQDIDEFQELLRKLQITDPLSANGGNILEGTVSYRWCLAEKRFLQVSHANYGRHGITVEFSPHDCFNTVEQIKFCQYDCLSNHLTIHTGEKLSGALMLIHSMINSQRSILGPEFCGRKPFLITNHQGMPCKRNPISTATMINKGQAVLQANGSLVIHSVTESEAKIEKAKTKEKAHLLSATLDSCAWFSSGRLITGLMTQGAITGYVMIPGGTMSLLLMQRLGSTSLPWLIFTRQWSLRAIMKLAGFVLPVETVKDMRTFHKVLQRSFLSTDQIRARSVYHQYFTYLKLSHGSMIIRGSAHALHTLH